jgi:hypothetical protein
VDISPTKELLADTSAKEKEWLKERYESRIAELDSTIRGLESKKPG